VNRRAFFWRAAGLSATGIGSCAGYAYAIEPHWPEVVRRDLPIPALPSQLEGASLLQISDTHVGREVDSSYLVRSFQMAQELAPDLAVVTGDLVSVRGARDSVVFEQLRSVLSHLPHGRMGTFAILGNHDYAYSWSDAAAAARVVAELERIGARVLRNSAASIAGLDIVGVDDLWARRIDPHAALRQRRGSASLVLCHNPDAVDDVDWGDYRGWILAGHTHGGQCRLPFLPPPILPIRNRRYAAGHVALDNGGTLYVNRGLGHLERVRFNVRPEITLFTLRRGTNAPRA
jgi:predicted MPP superfamily phosphohydrolase